MVGTSFVGRAAADKSEGKRPTGHIVGTKTKRGVRAAERRASDIGRIMDFGDIGFAVSGKFPEEVRDELRSHTDVRYVEQDGTVTAIGESLPWGIDRVDADVAHNNGETGSGGDVAIIDTGIDSDHPDLQANLGDGYAAVTCEGSNCNYAWDDDNDHGTHCAGIADAMDNSEGVIGVSTEATLHAVKVLDSNGSGTFSDVADGVKWVADQGYDVGSMSIGASSGSQTIKDACQYAYDKGVLLVAAAGNDGPCSDCISYPAAYDTVVAVTAMHDSGELAGYSSTGPEAELIAPGSQIYSTVIGGYDTFSGTSMACPHVAGGGVQLMANGYSNTEARSKLQNTAEDLGLSDNEQGYGLLDVAASLGYDSSTIVDVDTDEETDVGDTSVTMNGTLVDLGDSSSADVGFKYHNIDDDTWHLTSTETLSSTGSYSITVSDLQKDTSYEFRAKAWEEDGDTDAGAWNSFQTGTSDSGAAVSTDSPTDVDDTSATLNGTLTDLGGASSADVSFDYRESGTSTWSSTSTQTLSSTGSFSQDVTGLSTGVDYEYRAVVTASDGDTDTGSTVSFTTTASVAVSTDAVSSVGTDNATLNGTLTNLGGASSADVSFEWRQTGASSWNTTSTQTLSSTESFSQDVTGLSSGTDYEYRAVADASDGDTDTGSTVSFTTNTSDTSVAVSTESPSSVGETNATLNGDLTNLGGASSADVSFDYRESGTSTWSSTSTQTLSSTGTFSQDISGLSSGTDYEYRAVADASDGDTDTGSTVSFTTATSSDTAPAVDSYTVTEAGSPNPHAEITADWSVSDADGDLDTVLVEVIDSSGSVVDSSRTNASGSSASGTDKFKLKHVGSSTYDVQLTVTDAAGNSTTQTQTVSS
jgi:subtilisin family serine protease